MTIENLKELVNIFKKSNGNFEAFCELKRENNELRSIGNHEQLFEVLLTTTEEKLVLSVYKFGFNSAISKIYYNEV